MGVKKRKTRRQPSKLAVDSIETKCITLVDELGRERASITSGLDDVNRGFTVVHLNDDQGRPRLTLQVDSSGNPGIVLFTPNNACGVSIAVNSAGNGLSIGDANGQPGISIGFPGPQSNDPRGSGPTIDVVDIAGQRTWSVFEGTTAHSHVLQRKK